MLTFRAGKGWEHFGSRSGKHNIQHSRGFTCILEVEHTFKCPVGLRPACLAPCRSSFKMVEWAEKY